MAEIQLKSTLHIQKNNECSSALLDLNEYYDSVIPVAFLQEWLNKYLELKLDVTRLFYTVIGPDGLPPIYLLNEDSGKYPAVEKFHDVYLTVKIICEEYKDKPQAVVEPNFIL